MKRFLIPAISIFLGFTFYGAGMAKLFSDHAFFGWIGPVWLIENLEPHGLGFYGKFIALSQIIIGYMLFTTRFKLIGSIMMIPLIGNILMVTISLQWKGTPIVLAFLMLLNLILLWQYRDFFAPLVNENHLEPPVKKRKYKSWLGNGIWFSGLALQLFAISVSYYNWYLALAFSLLGIGLSILSFKVDRVQESKLS